MSTWKAVYVEQDTPTETEGWYVIGFADSISPVVLKVEGSDTDGLREAIAITVARSMNRNMTWLRQGKASLGGDAA